MNIIACMRVQDMPISTVPGVVRVPCARCKAEVWISPSGQEQMTLMNATNEGETGVWCTHCVAASDLSYEIVPYGQRALDEIEAATGIRFTAEECLELLRPKAKGTS
ncbi:MAG: hypothetical protein HY369_04290 [Candidatus Aenigmarchaeota archaeon]|nr:hypothetical protein [Candidatus Aenigmarchaeota archaeon]